MYLKEKTENQHWQLKCRTYQQKYEQLQKNYDAAKQKYKQRLHEERLVTKKFFSHSNRIEFLCICREIFERTKNKYLDHIKNVQNDLQETRQLLEKDAELKVNQESAYQQLIDERRQLLTRYHVASSDVEISAQTSSPIVDELHTHPQLISNITFYRQVFFSLLH